jgi:FixJ family two-component response regulator
MATRQTIVAVVEDDLSVLRATRDLLDALGVATSVFSSAEEFLERGAEARPDCLLLDIHLGGMSGIDLSRQLADNGSTLPVIFMTALDDERTRMLAMQAGCVAFLRKPCAARDLMDAIHTAVLRT